MGRNAQKKSCLDFSGRASASKTHLNSKRRRKFCRMNTCTPISANYVDVT